MKNILKILTPIKSALFSMLIIACFFRIYLTVYTNQVVSEFSHQNTMELNAGDSFKLITKLNAFSSVTNWICITGKIKNNTFYEQHKGDCSSGILKQQNVISMAHANNINIAFTLRFPKEVEYLFALFFTLQAFILLIVIRVTRKSEEEKRKSEIRINKLARQMSHDIRSPLSTLNTILSEIDIKNNELKVMAVKSLKRINEISNNLLDKSNPFYVNIEMPKIESRDLKEVIYGLIQEKKIEFKNVDIDYLFCSEKAISKFDKIELSRIFSNLINNSVEAKANKIIIEIHTINNSQNILTIKDNGIGINAKILSELGKKEITTKLKGNGLGVMHTKESIASWKGDFLISSRVNVGTECKIILPSIEVELKTESLCVLLDNDELVRQTWIYQAKKNNINFISFENYNNLLFKINEIPKDSNFYIDSDLGDSIKGEDIAIELYDKGYENIYMATGSDAESFKYLNFLKGVISKKPPF